MPAGRSATDAGLAAATTRSIQRRIIPLLLVLYFVAYLDRINLGFAALSMNAALGITNEQFGLLAGIFFLGYFFFEVPSNLLLHRIGARVWIARILITWGVVAMLTGFARNLTQLFVARFLLGAGEAGFFPGIILYLTYWFPEGERARVIALFSTALPVANILGAPVSGFVLDHAHWAGIESWRWLLVLEGIPAVACGILTYYVLPSRPAEATFLSPEQKDLLIAELAAEDEEKTKAMPLTAARTLAHPRIWHMAACLFGFDIALYAMTFYMPQALKAMTAVYSNTAVGFLVMVPHLAGLVAMVFVSRSSDRRKERRRHAAFAGIAGGIALILLATLNSPSLSLVLWSLAAMGLYSFLGPFFAIPSGLLAGFSAASGLALINSVGNLGGFVGPSLIGALAHGKGGIYRGLIPAGGAVIASSLLTLLLPVSRRQLPR